jgi:hypothetical protein
MCGHCLDLFPLDKLQEIVDGSSKAKNGDN